jgi:hypothetical protein
LSKYRYGKKDVFAKFPSVEARKPRATRLDREFVIEEVGNIRESLNEIENLLSQISDLSNMVYGEIDAINMSVKFLEDQL